MQRWRGERWRREKGLGSRRRFIVVRPRLGWSGLSFAYWRLTTVAALLIACAKVHVILARIIPIRTGTWVILTFFEAIEFMVFKAHLIDHTLSLHAVLVLEQFGYDIDADMTTVTIDISDCAGLCLQRFANLLAHAVDELSSDLARDATGRVRHIC